LRIVGNPAGKNAREAGSVTRWTDLGITPGGTPDLDGGGGKGNKCSEDLRQICRPIAAAARNVAARLQHMTRRYLSRLRHMWLSGLRWQARRTS
jgi:hypothetical protein